MSNGFNEEGFRAWLEDTFSIDGYGRDVVSNILEYGYNKEYTSKDQFVYFVSDLLPEVEFLDVARFCDQWMLTDTTINELESKTYTWDDLYNTAIGACCGDGVLKAKDTARWEVKTFAIELGKPDLDEAECPEDEIEDYCAEYHIKFDIYGHIVEIGGLRVTS